MFLYSQRLPTVSTSPDHSVAHTPLFRSPAPLQVAGPSGTLASLYSDRIDLGLGRAPGTDQATVRALRRYFDGADAFPQDVAELLRYFEPVGPGQPVQAVPGGGIEVPVWLLGSRSEEHTSELQSLMRISYAGFCLKKKIHEPMINSSLSYNN